jgi:hypothetical protein
VNTLPEVPAIGFKGRARNGHEVVYVGISNGWHMWANIDTFNIYLCATPYSYEFGSENQKDIIGEWVAPIPRTEKQ